MMLKVVILQEHPTSAVPILRKDGKLDENNQKWTIVATAHVSFRRGATKTRINRFNRFVLVIGLFIRQARDEQYLLPPHIPMTSYNTFLLPYSATRAILYVGARRMKPLWPIDEIGSRDDRLWHELSIDERHWCGLHTISQFQVAPCMLVAITKRSTTYSYILFSTYGSRWFNPPVEVT